MIKGEPTFDMRNPIDFLRCWSFLYRVQEYLYEQLSWESFDMKAAIQALRQNPWRSKDREKKSGNMRGDNTPSDVPLSIDEQMEDVAVEDVCMGPVPEDASFISTPQAPVCVCVLF